MHELQTIVTDDRCVCLSVSLSVTRLNSAAHAVCAAHSLQPLPNYFGLLLYLSLLTTIAVLLLQLKGIS